MSESLAPEIESLIRQKVESGHYSDASEVVREALRLLEERDQEKLARLRAALAVGRDDLARGEIVEWTPDFLERLKAEAAENVRLRKPIKDEIKP